MGGIAPLSTIILFTHVTGPEIDFSGRFRPIEHTLNGRMMADITELNSGTNPPADLTTELDRARYDRATAERVANLAVLAADPGVWTAHGSSQYPDTTCAINGSVIVFIQSVEGSDGTFVRSIVAQTNADMHNPYVFVGVTLAVYVDVFDNQGTVLCTFYHEIVAGAVLDPKGNNPTKSWIDTKVMPQPRLDRVAGVRIRFANVS